MDPDDRPADGSHHDEHEHELIRAETVGQQQDRERDEAGDPKAFRPRRDHPIRDFQRLSLLASVRLRLHFATLSAAGFPFNS